MKYWITLRGKEEFPMVVDISKHELEKGGFIRGDRHYKDGNVKAIGFHMENVLNMEEFDIDSDEIVVDK